jgi:hypothetical protein
MWGAKVASSMRACIYPEIHHQIWLTNGPMTIKPNASSVLHPRRMHPVCVRCISLRGSYISDKRAYALATLSLARNQTTDLIRSADDSYIADMVHRIPELFVQTIHRWHKISAHLATIYKVSSGDIEKARFDLNLVETQNRSMDGNI